MFRRSIKCFFYAALFSLTIIILWGSANAHAQNIDLNSTLDNFIQERCHNFQVLSRTVNSFSHKVSVGAEDYVFEVIYKIKWAQDGMHPFTRSDLTIKVVNRWEGDWYVFGGDGLACDFTNLPYYSE